VKRGPGDGRSWLGTRVPLACEGGVSGTDRHHSASADVRDVRGIGAFGHQKRAGAQMLEIYARAGCEARSSPAT
jgi:hypothetical protein